MKIKTCRGRRIRIDEDADSNFCFIIENSPMSLVSPYLFDTADDALIDAREYIKTFITKENKLKPGNSLKKYRRKSK